MFMVLRYNSIFMYLLYYYNLFVLRVDNVYQSQFGVQFFFIVLYCYCFFWDIDLKGGIVGDYNFVFFNVIYVWNCFGFFDRVFVYEQFYLIDIY